MTNRKEISVLVETRLLKFLVNTGVAGYLS